VCNGLAAVDQTEPNKSDAVTATISTFSRKTGAPQIMAGPHPLYYYKPDKQPGDTKGQDIKGFGGEWYLLAPDGSEREKKKNA
jgi:predicted lipoprotein with Yx(FWY)xxD motif